MPIDYRLYPQNWKTEIRPRILNRANHKCEFCGVNNKALGYRDISGKFFEIYPNEDPAAEQMPGEKIIQIVLTVAHLNHNIQDNDDVNLKALCQRCHLHYDREHHAETRRKNKQNKEQTWQGKLIP